MKKKYPVNLKIMLAGGGALLLSGMCLTIGILSNQEVRSQQGKSPFKPHSLVSALPTEIGQAAIDHTLAQFSIMSGSPQVLLTRSITVKDLPSLGLPKINFAALEPPLMLVILKGDFDISNLPGGGNIPKSNWHWRVGYIAYVMDLKAGLPTLTMGSPQGGIFRKALNNPNLPDDLPANPAKL
jgi:hypothetical protein